jgi:hypothetical protein
MASNTRMKLLYAIFMLERMKEIENDPRAASCFLDAFLNMARSIIKIMQTEYQNSKGFKEWFQKKNEELKNDEINKLIYKKRRMTTYFKPVELHGDAILEPTAPIVVGTTMATVVTYANGHTNINESELLPSNFVAESQASITPLGITKKIQWYFDEYPERDVIDVCQLYIDKLEVLVTECESQFTIK